MPSFFVEDFPSDPSGVGPVINPPEWTDCSASKRKGPCPCLVFAGGRLGWFGVFLEGFFLFVCLF